MSHKLSRRAFVKRTAAAAVTAPYIVSASALVKDGRPAPSNRITMGCIGVGGMGNHNLGCFLSEKDCQVIAVCDVDRNNLNNTKKRVDDHYKNQDCAACGDFRELIARTDIDAISLATPDHWHAIPAITAAKAGKDIYGEKPFSHSLAEGIAMVEAVHRYGRVWQTGSWQRSQDNFRFACELVRNGRIGKVHTVNVGLPSGSNNPGAEGRRVNPESPPEHLNYDFWVGPSPDLPYIQARSHFHWRWHLDYGGGQLMDWIGHHNDIAHWGLGLDYSGPIEVEATGDFLDSPVWNHALEYKATCKYKDGLTIYLGSGKYFRGGTQWIGENDRWIHVDRGSIDANPKSILEEKIGSNEIHLFRSPGHWRNFLDCVKSRQVSLTPAEVAHRSATPGHLAHIAMTLGRTIKWDPAKQEIIGDIEAARLLGPPMRSPWRL
jgi:predicted dehydrogenase